MTAYSNLKDPVVYDEDEVEALNEFEDNYMESVAHDHAVDSAREQDEDY